MSKVPLQTRSQVHLYLLGFENINMYAKGIYRIKIEAQANNENCLIETPKPLGRFSQLGKKENQQFFTQEFPVRFQNEKVQINELLFIESPSLKYNKSNQITIKLTLLKAESSTKEQDGSPVKYNPLRTSYLIVRFLYNTYCEYTQCSFQEPFLSTLSAVIFVQPSCVGIEMKHCGKSCDKEVLCQLRKEVKKLRYNSYLLGKKFKKIFYGPCSVVFTLPKMFVSGEFQMDQVNASEEMFLDYLLQYEETELSPEDMNYELLSICFKNDELSKIFDENCLKNTVCTTKLKMDFEEKEKRRYRSYVVQESYKERFQEEYKPLLKQKLKLLSKQMQLSYNDECINSITSKMESVFQETIPNEMPCYPLILQETELLKPAEPIELSSTKRIRYILVLAHGYQGSPDDLLLLANGFKNKFKKTKYLILKSYRTRMGQGIECMANAAVQEIDNYMDDLDFNEKKYRIVMIGHSMGGLILREAANKIKYQENLYAYVSLGTPHLGYLQGLKLHIRAGLSLFSNLYNNPCLNQLSGKDSEDFHESALYKMSSTGGLSNFRKIALVSSNRDKYVSWHSARIQNFNKDFLKQHTFCQNEMVNNILGKTGKIERIDRLEVQFKLNESSMDKLIGRTCHIKLLTDGAFIQLLCNQCLPQLLN